MTGAGDALLYILSVNRSLSWQRLRNVVEVLRQQGTALESARVLRERAAKAMDCLGHAEFSDHTGDLRLSVCSPTLIRLPTKEPILVLAGARSPAQLLRWSEYANNCNGEMKIDAQPGDLGFLYPNRISFRFSDTDQCEKFASLGAPASNMEPVSWLLGQVSAALAEAVTEWKWKPMADLNWPKATFDPVRCYFWNKKDSLDVELTRYEDVVRGQMKFRARDGAVSADVTPEWGRYWMVSKVGHRVVDYDEAKLTFTHPQTMPLPKLMSRALTACSGLMPTASSYPHEPGRFRSPKLTYSGVPKTLATLLMRKLGQTS